MTFSTLDPSTATVALSNGNLTASGGGGATTGAFGKAEDAATSGKIYFEVTCTAFTGGDTGVGIADPASTYPDLGNNATVGAILFPSGNVWINGGNTGPISNGIPSGDVIGIAVDFDANLIWFKDITQAGTWNTGPSNDPNIGVGGKAIPSGHSWVPAFINAGTGASATFNFGASAFVGPVPNGFTTAPNRRAVVVTQIGYTTVAGDPQNLVDGDPDTGWTPAAQVPSGGLSIGCIQFDLLSGYMMSSFACVFANPGSFGSARLLCSDFDANLPPFNIIHDGDQVLGTYSQTVLGSGDPQAIATQTRPRRYFRLVGNADAVDGATDGTELLEFQFVPSAVVVSTATPRVSQLAAEIINTQATAHRVTTLAAEVLSAGPGARRVSFVAAEVLRSIEGTAAPLSADFLDGDDDALTAILEQVAPPLLMSGAFSDGNSDALTATPTIIESSDNLSAAFTDGDSDVLGITVPRKVPVMISLMATGR